MPKTILITGATDGIGLETAKKLAGAGHRVLVHGRNPAKLKATADALSEQIGGGPVESYQADLSVLSEVTELAAAVRAGNDSLDVLINNAGVFKVVKTITDDKLDVRFVVNAIAPYYLSQLLMPLLSSTSRIVNVSSAAQAPVDINALAGQTPILDDMSAYAQSKLAITMWSRHMAGQDGPVVIAVNPGSLLGSKMVKEAFGQDGGDLAIGAGILFRAAVDDEFANASGLYFDNDSGDFGAPHNDALDKPKSEKVVAAIEAVLASLV